MPRKPKKSLVEETPKDDSQDSGKERMFAMFRSLTWLHFMGNKGFLEPNEIDEIEVMLRPYVEKSKKRALK
jgi:hypothetical protein